MHLHLSDFLVPGLDGLPNVTLSINHLQSARTIANYSISQALCMPKLPS
jgi:hypothetical protein